MLIKKQKCQCCAFGDGIHIFGIDLVFDLLNDQHLILFFPEIHQNWTNYTDCMFGCGELVNFSSLVNLLLRLDIMTYDLSVVSLGLVLGL